MHEDLFFAGEPHYNEVVKAIRESFGSEDLRSALGKRLQAGFHHTERLIVHAVRPR